MRRAAAVGLAIVVLLALAGGAAEAHTRWRGGVYVGVGPWFWPGPLWTYPYWDPYYARPSIVVEEPPVYIERPPEPAAPPAAAYWYYCRSAGAYYPDVQTCPEDWVPVPPRSP